jgi:hypothetical protein
MVLNGTQDTDDPMVKELEDRIAVIASERDQHSQYIDSLTEQIKRYEKARKALSAEPPRKHKRDTAQGYSGTARIGPERYEEAKEALFRYAQDHEEFRQVEFRTDPNGYACNSSVGSQLFERFRQDNLVRLARVQTKAKGNVPAGKYFRLTREALNGR